MAATKSSWSCKDCTFLNLKISDRCSICHSPNTVFLLQDEQYATVLSHQLNKKKPSQLNHQKKSSKSGRKRTFNDMMNNNNTNNNNNIPHKIQRLSNSNCNSPTNNNNKLPTDGNLQSKSPTNDNNKPLPNDDTLNEYMDIIGKDVLSCAVKLENILKDILNAKININNTYNKSKYICNKVTKGNEGEMVSKDKFHCQSCLQNINTNNNRNILGNLIIRNACNNMDLSDEDNDNNMDLCDEDNDNNMDLSDKEIKKKSKKNSKRYKKKKRIL